MSLNDQYRREAHQVHAEILRLRDATDAANARYRAAYLPCKIRSEGGDASALDELQALDAECKRLSAEGHRLNQEYLRLVNLAADPLADRLPKRTLTGGQV